MPSSTPTETRHDRDIVLFEAVMTLHRRAENNAAYEAIEHIILGCHPGPDFADLYWPHLQRRLERDRQRSGAQSKVPVLWRVAYIVAIECGKVPPEITDEYLELLESGSEGHRITAATVRNHLGRYRNEVAAR